LTSFKSTKIKYSKQYSMHCIYFNLLVNALILCFFIRKFVNENKILNNLALLKKKINSDKLIENSIQWMKLSKMKWK